MGEHEEEADPEPEVVDPEDPGQRSVVRAFRAAKAKTFREEKREYLYDPE